MSSLFNLTDEKLYADVPSSKVVNNPKFVKKKNKKRNKIQEFFSNLGRQRAVSTSDLTSKDAYFSTPSFDNDDTVGMGPKSARRHLFGVPLEKAWPNGNIPDSIMSLFGIVYKNRATTEGLFRKCARKEDLTFMIDCIDQSDDVVPEDRCNVKVAAGVVKAFVRDIPEGLLLSIRADDWYAVSQVTNTKKRLTEISSLMDQLPRPHHRLFTVLLVTLHAIAQEHATNKMTASALSICWTPNMGFLSLPSVHDSPATKSALSAANIVARNTGFCNLLEFIIDKAPELIPKETQNEVIQEFEELVPITEGTGLRDTEDDDSTDDNLLEPRGLSAKDSKRWCSVNDITEETPKVTLRIKKPPQRSHLLDPNKPKDLHFRNSEVPKSYRMDDNNDFPPNSNRDLFDKVNNDLEMTSPPLPTRQLVVYKDRPSPPPRYSLMMHMTGDLSDANRQYRRQSAIVPPSPSSFNFDMSTRSNSNSDLLVQMRKPPASNQQLASNRPVTTCTTTSSVYSFWNRPDPGLIFPQRNPQPTQLTKETLQEGIVTPPQPKPRTKLKLAVATSSPLTISSGAIAPEPTLNPPTLPDYESAMDRLARFNNSGRRLVEGNIRTDQLSCNSNDSIPLDQFTAKKANWEIPVILKIPASFNNKDKGRTSSDPSRTFLPIQNSERDFSPQIMSTDPVSKWSDSDSSSVSDSPFVTTYSSQNRKISTQSIGQPYSSTNQHKNRFDEEDTDISSPSSSSTNPSSFSEHPLKRHKEDSDKPSNKKAGINLRRRHLLTRQFKESSDYFSKFGQPISDNPSNLDTPPSLPSWRPASSSVRKTDEKPRLSSYNTPFKTVKNSRVDRMAKCQSSYGNLQYKSWHDLSRPQLLEDDDLFGEALTAGVLDVRRPAVQIHLPRRNGPHTDFRTCLKEGELRDNVESASRGSGNKSTDYRNDQKYVNVRRYSSHEYDRNSALSQNIPVSVSEPPVESYV